MERTDPQPGALQTTGNAGREATACRDSVGTSETGNLFQPGTKDAEVITSPNGPSRSTAATVLIACQSAIKVSAGKVGDAHAGEMESFSLITDDVHLGAVSIWSANVLVPMLLKSRLVTSELRAPHVHHLEAGSQRATRPDWPAAAAARPCSEDHDAPSICCISSGDELSTCSTTLLH
jgi:hypothetical protein